MANRITGRVEVLVNGQLLLNRAGFTASGIGISGQPNVKKTEIMGDTGLHGFKEEIVLAKCAGTITDRSDVPLDGLAKINGDGTVIFRSVNGGKCYTMLNATCLGDFSVKAGEGDTNIEFVGPYWTETVDAS
jgi:hypothetical protein